MTLKMLNDFLYQIECAYEDCIKSDSFEFEDTPKFDKIFDVLFSKYYKIGSGSSRRVFALDKNTVIKMAKDRRGMAQNLVELRVFIFMMVVLLNLLADIVMRFRGLLYCMIL